MATELEEWVAERSSGIRSMQVAWTHAISIAANAGWTSEAILGLACDLRHPSSLIKLCESEALEASSSEESVLRRLEKRADESSFSIHEWIRALETLLQFLIRENRSSKLEVQLDYLACSGEYLSSSGSPFLFEQGVMEFLSEFGFDG